MNRSATVSTDRRSFQPNPEALDQMVRELNAAGELEEVARLVLENGVERLEADSGDLIVLERETRNLKLVHSTRERDVEQRVIKHGKGLCGWAAEHGRPVVVGNVAYDTRYRATWPETQSELVYPLVVDDQLIGLLNFESNRENAFTHFDLEWVQRLAGHAGLAIRSAAERERIDALQRIDRAIFDKGLGRKETLEVLLEECVRLLELINCQIAEYDQRDHLIIVASIPTDAEGKRIPIESCLSGKAVMTRELAFTDDIENEVSYRKVTEGLEATMQAEMAMPLVVGDKVLGVINVESSHAFSAGDRQFLAKLASQAAISLQTSALVESLRRQKKHLRALHAIDAAIMDPSCSLEETLRLILERGLSLLGCPHGRLLLMEGEVLVVQALADGGEGSGNGELGESIESGACWEVAKSREPSITVDVSANSSEWTILGNRCRLIFPLAADDRVVGVLEALTPREDLSTEDHHEFLTNLAKPIAVAIQNAELQGIILELGGLMAEINAAGDLEETLSRIHDSALKYLGVSTGVILVVNRDTGKLERKRGNEIVEGAEPLAHLVDSELIETVRKSREPKALDDITGLARLEPASRSALAAPLCANGETLGVLYLESREPRYFSKHHVTLVKLLADGAALALESARSRMEERDAGFWDRINDYNRDLLHWVVNKASPIRGCAGRLRDDLDKHFEQSSSPAEGDAQTILRDIDLILRNSDAMLEVQEWFRGTAKKLDLTEFDLGPCIEEAVGSQLASNNLVDIAISEDLPRVVADRLQTEKIFENLIKNALEAMEGVDKKSLRIEAQSGRESSRVLVSVTDSGCGIEESKLERIFDPHYSTKKGGTGYGLALARTVIQRMNGKIWVKSKVGSGTTFNVTLPAGSRAVAVE